MPREHRKMKSYVGLIKVRVIRQKKKLKSGEEKEYKVYIATIPKKMVDELELSDGDIVLIVAKKTKLHEVMNKP